MSNDTLINTLWSADIKRCNSEGRAPMTAEANFRRGAEAALALRKKMDSAEFQDAVQEAVAESEDLALECLGKIDEFITIRDSYGVPQSEFVHCRHCGATDGPGKFWKGKIEHDEDCPYAPLEEMFKAYAKAVAAAMEGKPT